MTKPLGGAMRASRLKHSTLWIWLSILIASRVPLQAHGGWFSRLTSFKPKRKSIGGEVWKQREPPIGLTPRRTLPQTFDGEKCEFQFNSAEGVAQERLTVQTVGSLHCDHLTPQQLFDGIEYSYSERYDFFTSQRLFRPEFDPIEHESYFPSQRVSTSKDHIIKLVQRLSEGLWQETVSNRETVSNTKTVSNRVVMQPPRVRFEVIPGLLPGTVRPRRWVRPSPWVITEPDVYMRHNRIYNDDLDRFGGVQLVVKMPVTPLNLVYSIFVIFGWLTLQEVFDNLSTGETMKPQRIYEKDWRSGIMHSLPTNKFKYIAEFCKNSAPFKKYEGSNTIVINARSPQDNAKIAYSKDIFATFAMTIGKRKQSPEVKNVLWSPEVKNVLWFDTTDFEVKKEELATLTDKECIKQTYYSGVRIEITLPLDKTSRFALGSMGKNVVEFSKFSIIALFSNKYSLAKVFRGLSRGTFQGLKIVFVLLGDQMVKYLNTEELFGRIRDAPLVDKEDKIRNTIEIQFWSQMDRYLVDPADKDDQFEYNFLNLCHLLWTDKGRDISDRSSSDEPASLDKGRDISDRSSSDESETGKRSPTVKVKERNQSKMSSAKHGNSVGQV